jgi:hypothetical protein
MNGTIIGDLLMGLFGCFCLVLGLFRHLCHDSTPGCHDLSPDWY